ncbi:MAG: protein kinase [Gemmataceae bacterium]
MPDARGQRPGAKAKADSNPAQPTTSGSRSRTALPDGQAPSAGGEAAPKATVELPSELQALGKFEAIRKLGEGGMGAVFLARHTFLDRPVAIKVMSGAAVGHAEARERFLAEMRAGGRLHHPNVAQTIDAAQAGDTLFLVMEFVEGASLDRVVARKGPLPRRLACRCVRQAALGLQHAHERGMAHRDVKPANLMVARDGTVKVLDFGLARLPAAQGQSRKTEFQTFMGTADYVAPEQAKDARTADTRSDIYSLGCTLYFLLAGRPPFEGATFIEVATKHVTDEPEPLLNLPAELWAVIARMMAKKREDRYQTPAEVAEALQPFAEKQDAAEESSEIDVTPPPLPKPKRRVPVWLVAGAGVAVPLTAGLVWLLVSLLFGDWKEGGVPAPPANVQSARDSGQEPIKNKEEPEVAPVVKLVSGAADRTSPREEAPTGAARRPVPAEDEQDRPPARPPAKEPEAPRPDPEKVAQQLEKAKADYKEAREQARADLVAALVAEAKQYEKEKKYKLQEQTEEDLKRFERVGILPAMPGLKPEVDKYIGKLSRARSGLDAAYNTAIQDFRAAGETAKALSAEDDQRELQKEKLPTGKAASAPPRPKRNKR